MTIFLLVQVGFKENYLHYRFSLSFLDLGQPTKNNHLLIHSIEPLTKQQLQFQKNGNKNLDIQIFKGVPPRTT
jgi:hypothetical protein